jgi:single-strand DNA-binding protein
MNSVTLIGNLGADPEIRRTQSGEAIANLRIATTDKWKDKNGERKERTEWHTVAVFGPLAGIVEKYLRKGAKVAVVGALRTRKWQDQSGADRYSTEVVLSGPQAQLEMLGDGQAGDRGRREEQPQRGRDVLAPAADDYGDGIPFLPSVL